MDSNLNKTIHKKSSGDNGDIWELFIRCDNMNMCENGIMVLSENVIIFCEMYLGVKCY